MIHSLKKNNVADMCVDPKTNTFSKRGEDPKTNSSKSKTPKDDIQNNAPKY